MQMATSGWRRQSHSQHLHARRRRRPRSPSRSPCWTAGTGRPRCRRRQAGSGEAAGGHHAPSARPRRRQTAITLPADHLPPRAVSTPLRASSRAAARAETGPRPSITGRRRSAKARACAAVVSPLLGPLLLGHARRDAGGVAQPLRRPGASSARSQQRGSWPPGARPSCAPRSSCARPARDDGHDVRPPSLGLGHIRHNELDALLLEAEQEVGVAAQAVELRARCRRAWRRRPCRPRRALRSAGRLVLPPQLHLDVLLDQLPVTSVEEGTSTAARLGLQTEARGSLLSGC